jgi:hypothetical protein
MAILRQRRGAAMAQLGNNAATTRQRRGAAMARQQHSNSTATAWQQHGKYGLAFARSLDWRGWIWQSKAT